MALVVYTAQQISRLESSDDAMIEWAVELGDGRTGRVRVPLDVYESVEATDKDEYVREGLADDLTRRQLPDDVLLAGEHVATL
jgi:outer membrane translocation and assembly module TamA